MRSSQYGQIQPRLILVAGLPHIIELTDGGTGLRCHSQRFELFLRLAHGLCQQLLLLRQQLGIGRGELQELLYILELGLRIFDIAVYVLKGGRELGGNRRRSQR